MRYVAFIPVGSAGAISLPDNPCDQIALHRWVDGLPIGYAAIILLGRMASDKSTSAHRLHEIETHFAQLPKVDVQMSLKARRRRDIFQMTLSFGAIVLGVVLFLMGLLR